MPYKRKPPGATEFFRKQSKLYTLFQQDRDEQAQQHAEDRRNHHPHRVKRYDWLLFSDVVELVEEAGLGFGDEELRSLLTALVERRLLHYGAPSDTKQEGWKL